eukprot:6179420-Pleurochrysis_carterae.AAC.6
MPPKAAVYGLGTPRKVIWHFQSTAEMPLTARDARQTVLKCPERVRRLLAPDIRIHGLVYSPPDMLVVTPPQPASAGKITCASKPATRTTECDTKNMAALSCFYSWMLLSK